MSSVTCHVQQPLQLPGVRRQLQQQLLRSRHQTETHRQGATEHYRTAVDSGEGTYCRRMEGEKETHETMHCNETHLTYVLWARDREGVVGNVGRGSSDSQCRAGPQGHVRGYHHHHNHHHHTRMGTSYRQQISHHPTTNQRKLGFMEFNCFVNLYPSKYLGYNLDIKERH